MRAWSDILLAKSKKLGSPGLICPDINPASCAFLVMAPWCCYSIPHGTFKSIFCVDLSQFSWCWTVLEWHRGDSDRPFFGEKRQSLSILGNSSPPQCAISNWLGKHHPWDVQGAASQNPAAQATVLLHPQAWHIPNLCNTGSTPGPPVNGTAKEQVIYQLSYFLCHRGVSHPIHLGKDYT